MVRAVFLEASCEEAADTQQKHAIDVEDLRSDSRRWCKCQGMELLAPLQPHLTHPARRQAKRGVCAVTPGTKQQPRAIEG